MPTLRQFEYLVAVADHRHFGKAAQAAAASQPTLSHQLRTLEQRLGVTLVERRTMEQSSRLWGVILPSARGRFWLK